MSKNTPDRDDTLLAETSGRMRTGNNTPVVLHEDISQARQETRLPVKRIIGTFFLSAGIAIGTGYAYYKHIGPFSSSQPAPSPSASSSGQAATKAPETPELPKRIDTPEKLDIVLKAANVHISAADFEKSQQKNIHLGALVLEPIVDESGNPTEPFTYKWVPLKSQIMVPLKDEDILVATLNKQPQSTNKIGHLGVQPMATTTDKQNPQIEYHYYHCLQAKNPGIASIAMVTEVGRNLTLYPLRLPVCKKNSEETTP